MEYYQRIFAQYFRVLNTLYVPIPCSKTSLVYMAQRHWIQDTCCTNAVTIRPLLRALIGGMNVVIKQWG